MKTLFLTSLLSLGAALSAGAQTAPTFTAVSATTVGSTDTNGSVPAAMISSLPSFAPATNGSWDLATVTLNSGASFNATHLAATAGFSTATFSDTATGFVSSLVNTTYGVRRNILQNTSGLTVQGDEVISAQVFSLASVTMTAGDNITVPAQVMAFSTPLPRYKLPATMSSSWSGTAKQTLNFNVTVASYLLSNAPAQHKANIYVHDSVVGWGRMRVPGASGPSAWMPVLQVRHTEAVMDSFYLNGTPAPAAMLTNLSLVQGQTDTTVATYFYRSGESYPLVQAMYASGNYSAPPSTVYVNRERIAPSTVAGVKQVEAKIFPNPVGRGGIMQLQIPSGSWNFSIVDGTGRLCTKGTVNAANGTGQIQVPQQLQPGCYVLHLSRLGEEASVAVLVP